MPKIATWDVQDGADTRQARAALKRRLFEEDFLDDVKRIIASRMSDAEAIAGVQAHAAETVNFCASLTKAVAVVYDYGCRRYLRGATTEQSAAFSDIVRESQASLLQSGWNVWAWLLGPTFVVPSMQAGEMRLTTVTPDVSHVQRRGDMVERVLWRDGAVYIEVSADGWRYFAAETGAELAPEKIVGAPVTHVATTNPPIATFRIDRPARNDWWCSTRHRGLALGTLEAAFWWAHLQWIRKTQSRKLLVAKAPRERIIADQTFADPELPFWYDGPPAEADFEVIDFNTGPKDHVEMIRFIGEQIAEREGIPGAEITFDNSSNDLGTVSLQLRREKLAHVHAQQVAPLVAGEVSLWAAVADYARAGGHRHAGKLPPPDEVRQMLAIEFPSPEVVTDPKARMELDTMELKLGLTSPAQIMQRRNPSLTLADCDAQMRANLENYASLLDFIAARNIPRDPGQATQTLAQAQGSVGGLTRAANQQAQETNAP